MSFLSVFKKVETFVAGNGNKIMAGTVALVDTVDPAVAPLVNLIYNGILKAESIATADNASKLSLVVDEVNNAVPLLNAGLTSAGKTVDAAKVSEASSVFTSAYVAFMNAYSTFAATVSPVPAVPATAAPAVAKA